MAVATALDVGVGMGGEEGVFLGRGGRQPRGNRQVLRGAANARRADPNVEAEGASEWQTVAASGLGHSHDTGDFPLPRPWLRRPHTGNIVRGAGPWLLSRRFPAGGIGTAGPGGG